MLFHLQNRFSVFEILSFIQDIRQNVHYVPEINLISEGTSIKAFYLLNKTIKKKSETQFCRLKTGEDDNANKNVPPNIPCTFSLFKVSAFFQTFSSRK